MQTVSIVLFRMFHYRIDFLNALRESLKSEDIHLNVYYGKPTQQSIERKDTEVLSWAHEIPTSSIAIGGKEILLQVPPKNILKSDIIICMQENRLLINYVLQLVTLFIPRCHFTFFGHGKNFQSTTQQGFREKFKKLVMNRSDHFFAYTELSEKVLLERGYDKNKITVVNNTIDAAIFSQEVQNVTDSALIDYKRKLNIPTNATIALFCGSIYDLKKPHFLVSACDKVREFIPNFHLIVLGAGPEENVFRDAAIDREWVHYRGMQKGEEKALAYRCCSVILNPGLVGLHIVDALSAGKPMITTDMPFHSPEFAYLDNNVNGIVTKENIDDYATETIELLNDIQRLELMSATAFESKTKYSLANMVAAFVDGIKKTTAT